MGKMPFFLLSRDQNRGGGGRAPAALIPGALGHGGEWG